jgi:hypothetical protein
MIRLKEKTAIQKMNETNQRILALSSGEGDKGNRGKSRINTCYKKTFRIRLLMNFSHVIYMS